MRLLLGKVLAGFVIFLVTFICGVASFKLFRRVTGTGDVETRLNSVQSFASGIFLATCLLHLLPEALEAVRDSVNSELPVCEMIVCFGFLSLLLLENFILSCHETTEGRSHVDSSVVVFSCDSKEVVYTEKSGSLQKSSTPAMEYGTVLDVNCNDGTSTDRDAVTRIKKASVVSRIIPDDHEESENEEKPLLKKHETVERSRGSRRKRCDGVRTPGGNFHRRVDVDSSDTSDESGAQSDSPMLKIVDIEVSTGPSKHPECRAGDCRDVNCTVKEQIQYSNRIQVKDQGPTKEPGIPPDKTAVLKSFVLLLALSLHTVFDGLVVGLQKDLAGLWTLLAAISLHKGLVSASIALSLLASHRNHPRASLVYLFLFSLVAPLGLVTGVTLTEAQFDAHAQTLTSGILQSVATGTFMYVTFMESFKERFDAGNRLLNVFLVCVGFGCICLLKIFLG